MIFLAVCHLFLQVIKLSSGDDALASSTSSTLRLRSLGDYSLATCNDMSSAGYYHDVDTALAKERVMIYLPDDTLECSSVEACQRKCERDEQSCSAPTADQVVLDDGIWSREVRNNPFAGYFKVLLPSCSSDEFSGTRDKSPETGNLVFHGRHILSSVLRDLVARFGIDQAQDVVFIGSGYGARGVARNCDFLAAAIATVNADARVRCVLDGPDAVPFWVNSDECSESSREQDERTKFLWGRQDDESCLGDHRDLMNSSQLAVKCGVFSRYWKDISTPFFLLSSQLDPDLFSRSTCGVSATDDDFADFDNGWRQGMIALAEAMSLIKPQNGWFIPNCDKVTNFLTDQFANERRKVRVKQVDGDSKVNALQALNNWLKAGSTYQAIDAFGVPNEGCSETKSLPLDLRPDLRLHQSQHRDEELRRAPGSYRKGGRRHFRRPYYHRPPTRFVPPRELFPVTYDYGPRFGPVVPAEAARPGRPPLNVDDIFDYDDLDLGLEFELGTRYGLGPVPSAGRAPPVRVIPRQRPPVADHPFVGGVVADPQVVTAPAVGGVVVPGRPPVRQTSILHTPKRRARLWRKLYYLEYLRSVYAKHYNAYVDEYFGTGIPVELAHLRDKPEGATGKIREELESVEKLEKAEDPDDQVETFS